MWNNIIKYGLITGVITAGYLALLYAGGMSIFSNWWITLLLYPILIFCLIFFAKKVRNENPDVKFDYGKAFVTVFVIGAIASVVMLIWNIILFNAIDKELGVKLTEQVIEQTMEMMEKFGAPASAIEESMKGFENMEDQFTVSGQVKSWATGLIVYAIIAAICAIFIKRKEEGIV